MTLLDSYSKNIPEYYKSMYMEGYSPEQILHAARQKMIRDLETQVEAEIEENEIPNAKIISEVKIR